MAFPYQIKQVFKLTQPEYRIETLPLSLDSMLSKAISDKGYETKDNWYVGKQALFNVPFRFNIELQKVADGFHIIYHLQLNNLVNGTLILSLIIGLLARMQFSYFMMFVAIVSMAFYTLSVLIMSGGINSMLKGLFKAYSVEELAMNYDAENQCPACGHVLEPQQTDCPECGLRVKQNRFTKPLQL